MRDDDERPNPDELLLAVSQEEQKNKKGRLKIFLGMSAGVGKTYTMLEEAQRSRALGIDVQVGVVETHKRAETERLLEGLTVIPLLEMSYRGVLFKELNLDKVIEIHPQLVLIDELAHTNVPGSRHIKRWQDVVEVIENGIDVFSTLNIQHVESLKDVVESIAELPIRETVPDSIIEMADSIELVDITPKELLERLKEGKVYLGDRSEQAALHFFIQERLTALREMALRFAAEKVDHDLKGMLSPRGRPFEWKTRERLLVLISPDESSQKLIRTCRRLAFNLNAPWIAVYVNDGKALSDEEKAALDRNLALARDLGADVITTSDPNIANAIGRIATQRGVTQIVVERADEHRGWRRLFYPSLVDQLKGNCENIDIHVLRLAKKIEPKKIKLSVSSSQLITYGFAFLAALLLGIINWSFLGSPDYFIAFYTALGLAMGSVTHMLRTQRQMLIQRESSSQALYEISREIAMAPSAEFPLPSVKRKLERILSGKCEIILKKPEGKGLQFKDTESLASNEKEQAVALWVFDYETEAGWSTDTLPASEFFYLPLKGFTQVVGVLAFRSLKEKQLSLETKNFLYTTGFQIASYIERHFVQKREQYIEALNQKEKIYQSILDLISEEIVTPMSTLVFAVEKIAKHEEKQEVAQATSVLTHILENISMMSSLRSNLSPMADDAHFIDEVIDASLKNTEQTRAPYRFKVRIAPHLPKIVFDFYLIEILICNLIINATRNSPPQSVIEIDLKQEEGILILSISDHSKGLSQDQLSAVSERFYRLPNLKSSGLGFGLSIAKTIAEIHGGVLIATKRQDGAPGATFSLHLPMVPPSQKGLAKK